MRSNMIEVTWPYVHYNCITTVLRWFKTKKKKKNASPESIFLFPFTLVAFTKKQDRESNPLFIHCSDIDAQFYVQWFADATAQKIWKEKSSGFATCCFLLWAMSLIASLRIYCLLLWYFICFLFLFCQKTLLSLKKRSFQIVLSDRESCKTA